MIENKHVGAIVWLSHSRLNTGLLAQSAKASIPPLLYAISQQLQLFSTQGINDPSTPSNTAPTSLPSSAGLEDGRIGRLSSNVLWHQVMSMCMNQKAANGMGSRNASSHTLGAVAAAAAAATGGGGSRTVSSTMAQGAVGGLTNNNNADILSVDSNFSIADYRPVRFNIAKSDSASTHALMRAYQTAIAQHQRCAPTVTSDGDGVEEIEVIAKAGQVSLGCLQKYLMTS